MKYLLYLLAFVLILPAGAFSQTETLTVLFLNDTHSTLAPLGPRNADLSGTQGGIARAASVIGNYELSGENVITLHGGDLSIGDLFYNKFFGVPELQILNMIGVDAMTAGNHEFDLGPSTFEAALTAAFGNPSTGFPILSANADLSLYPGNLSEYIKPYTVKTFGTFKVGIFGLTTHEANVLSNPSPVVISEDFLSIAGATVQTLLTTENCDFIICLSHYGIMADQALATYIPGINLIIGGHDHIPVPAMQINNTWIVQSEAFYSSIGKIEFEISPGSIVMKDFENIKLNYSIPEVPEISAIVNSLIAEIELTYGPVYTQQIGSLNNFMEEMAEDINKPGNHSTSAGNFISDAMLWKTKTDFAIEPGGSIAQALYKGPIVPADLFRMVGYGFNTDNGLGFRLFTASISGAELYKAVEILLAFLENEDYFPQFSGLTLKYNPEAPEGERVASIKINRKSLNPAAIYTFTSNELVMIMLDYFGVQYFDADILEGYSEFQNLCEYTEFLNGKIQSNREARIIAVGGNKELAEINAPGTGKGIIRNYPNPFNPTTMINYVLPSSGLVKLVVYNSIGEQAAVLVNEYKEQGEYDVTWNAENFAGGIYFYSIQSPGVSLSGKMILLK